jgi:hypothetical protein
LAVAVVWVRTNAEILARGRVVVTFTELVLLLALPSATEALITYVVFPLRPKNWIREVVLEATPEMVTVEAFGEVADTT